MPLTLHLVPLHARDGSLLHLTRALPAHLPVRARVEPAWAGAPAGETLHSAEVLEWLLSRAEPSPKALWLAVAGHPLAGDAGEVFGEATVSGPAAVVTDAFAANAEHRLLASAVHELGHLLGLEHCPTPRCAMYPSRTLAETDAKGPGLCQPCAARVIPLHHA